MPDWFNTSDFGFNQDVPAPVSIAEFSAPDFMDYGFGLETSSPSANVFVGEFAAPDWMDYGYGSADVTVEPPPISWEGEQTLPMDRPPYEYGAPVMEPATEVDSWGREVRDSVTQAAPPPAPTATTQSMAQTIKEISNAAMAAIGVVKAWETRKLAPNPVARATRPDGSVVTARSNGTIVTRDTQGRVTVAKPQVGLPQSTEDGFVIINNGDGTFTRINTQGQRETIRYPGGVTAGGITTGAAGSMSGGLLLALGVGAVALVALRK